RDLAPVRLPDRAEDQPHAALAEHRFQAIAPQRVAGLQLALPRTRLGHGRSISWNTGDAQETGAMSFALRRDARPHVRPRELRHVPGARRERTGPGAAADEQDRRGCGLRDRRPHGPQSLAAPTVRETDDE